jgi:hypothetical protein
MIKNVVHNGYEAYQDWCNWCNKSNFNMYLSAVVSLFALIGIYESILTAANVC